MNKQIKPDKESNVNPTVAEQITAFWQQGQFDYFLGVDNVKISYAKFLHMQASAPSIVIVPGRCESYLKYQELIFELHSQGYSIFIIDHRGQGLSGRLLADISKGYVNKFQDYVDDFQYFIENIVCAHEPIKPYILAHSMGGAIATRYMQDSPDAIKAAVISSPMLGFNSGIVPKVIAENLIAAKLSLNKMMSKTPWYFFGQKAYQPVNFNNNRLTHSPERYQRFSHLYQQNKAIQLGGVTSHWLAQGISAQKEIFAKINQLKTPILLLQAGSDIVVCQQAQRDFCQKLNALQPLSCPTGSPIKVKGAFHELFFEEDDYRNTAITHSLDWFKQHS